MYRRQTPRKPTFFASSKRVTPCLLSSTPLPTSPASPFSNTPRPLSLRVTPPTSPFSVPDRRVTLAFSRIALPTPPFSNALAFSQTASVASSNIQRLAVLISLAKRRLSAPWCLVDYLFGSAVYAPWWIRGSGAKGRGIRNGPWSRNVSRTHCDRKKISSR